MKITALAITALATVASVASADDYQPVLRALAAQEPTAPIADTLASDPTKQQSSSPVEAAAAATNTEHNVDDDSKKAKEWWGRPGWGHRWGGYGWGRPWGWVRWWLGWIRWRLGMVDVTHQRHHRHACNLPHSHTDGTEQGDCNVANQMEIGMLIQPRFVL
uniref:Uncharacterized protein n=1 Tax=Peronospora matthiolae TaxID=2874970 RepID=A0AAV1UVK4_9STRA